jgi:hypothetical protein
MDNARFVYQDENDTCFIQPEDGIEKISRNVVSFLQYYVAS